MSQIFGYISRTGAPIRNGLANDMMQAMADWKPDYMNFVELPHAALGALMLYTTAESLNEKLPYTCTDSGLTITADARIDNRDELSAVLSLTNNVQTNDSMYILRAYQKWGNDCCKHLLGDYAFAIWDSRKRELFCARDHIGARPIFYYMDSGKFIFATEPKGILASGEAPTKLTEDWIADLLVGVRPDKDQAPFEQMKKLPPAHYMVVTPDKFHLAQYWDLDITREIHYKREQDYYDEMRALIEQAIRRCTRSAFPVGAELSGGLDSSGIAAFAHAELKKRGEELSTFSHVLPEWAEGKIYPFQDEKRFINELCEYVGITKKYFITAEGKGILDEFQLCTQRFGYPTGYTFPIFCDALYEKAQIEGVKILLSGFPGDELVTSHGAAFYNELLHNHQYGTLCRELYACSDQKYFKAIRSFVAWMLQYYLPQFYRLLKGDRLSKINWQDNSFRCCVATDEYAEKMYLRDRLLKAITYSQFNNVRANERMQIEGRFVCFRLEQCAAHALYNHIEYRNPFSDRNLIEYVLALSPKFKVKNGVNRYPYRMAITEFIPERIRWRNNKEGATNPTVLTRLLKDTERIDDFLNFISEKRLFHSCIDRIKMYTMKSRLNHKQRKDGVYSQSFFNAWMLIIYFGYSGE